VYDGFRRRKLPPCSAAYKSQDSQREVKVLPNPSHPTITRRRAAV
jgi:hypothetical protein